MENLIEITSKKHIDMPGIQFCLKALSKDKHERRVHVTHALVKDGYMICTDGIRLHKYKLESSYPDGLYRVFKSLKSHIVLFKTDNDLTDYPAYEDLLKESGKPDYTDLDFYNFYISSSIHKIFKVCERPLDINFLSDLSGSYDVYITSDRAHFVNPLQEAIIMAIRV